MHADAASGPHNQPALQSLRHYSTVLPVPVHNTSTSASASTLNYATDTVHWEVKAHMQPAASSTPRAACTQCGGSG